MARKKRRERTMLMVKPCGVFLGYECEIIRRVTDPKYTNGVQLRIVGYKMMRLSKEDAEDFYPKIREKSGDKWVLSKWAAKLGSNAIHYLVQHGYDPEKIFGSATPEAGARYIRKLLISYITSGPVLSLIIEGPGAIRIVHKMMGGTSPIRAKPGTIRRELSDDSADDAFAHARPVINIGHASSDRPEAKKNVLFHIRQCKKQRDIIDPWPEPRLLDWLEQAGFKIQRNPPPPEVH